MKSCVQLELEIENPALWRPRVFKSSLFVSIGYVMVMRIVFKEQLQFPEYSFHHVSSPFALLMANVYRHVQPLVIQIRGS